MPGAALQSRSQVIGQVINLTLKLCADLRFGRHQGGITFSSASGCSFSKMFALHAVFENLQQKTAYLIFLTKTGVIQCL